MEDASTASTKASEDEDDEALDTVGAIVVDPWGNVAAALSSGGIAYKTPGRVGLAGCPRIGCNAVNARELFRCQSDSDEADDDETRPASDGRRKKRRCAAPRSTDDCSTNAFAVACSGRGEHFIRSGLVGMLSRRLETSNDMERALRCAELPPLMHALSAVRISLVVLWLQQGIRGRAQRQWRRGGGRRRFGADSEPITASDNEEGEEKEIQGQRQRSRLAIKSTWPIQPNGRRRDAGSTGCGLLDAEHCRGVPAQRAFCTASADSASAGDQTEHSRATFAACVVFVALTNVICGVEDVDQIVDGGNNSNKRDT